MNKQESNNLVERKVIRRMFTTVIFLAFSVFIAGDVFGQKTSKETKYSSFKVEVTGQGKPMILIPGLSSSGEVWESTVARYKANYECHVLTLAGFAGQPAIKAPFLEKVRIDLAAYIREKNLKKPTIVGHSLGGFMALWLASVEPDLTGRLVIVDSLPFLGALNNPNATPETIKPQAEAMRKGITATTQSDEQRRQAQIGILQTMISDPAKIALATEWGVKSDPGAIGQAMYEMFTTDLRPSLSRIKSPTLIIGTWAAYQQYTTRAAVEKTFRDQYANLPGYRFVMSEAGKHFVMYDDPKLLFSEMDAFLTDAGEKGKKSVK
ncbi:MAG TPA: alpha/beta hydrolase [Pyrinomonadaceae bacterium]|jgi:pimeloyl-ACP methyl ester carboxylesterase